MSNWHICRWRDLKSSQLLRSSWGASKEFKLLHYPRERGQPMLYPLPLSSCYMNHFGILPTHGPKKQANLPPYTWTWNVLRGPSLSITAHRGPEKLENSLNYLLTTEGITKRPVSGITKGNQHKQRQSTQSSDTDRLLLSTLVRLGPYTVLWQRQIHHPHCWGHCFMLPRAMRVIWLHAVLRHQWVPHPLLPYTQCQTHLGLPEQPLTHGFISNWQFLASVVTPATWHMPRPTRVAPFLHDLQKLQVPFTYGCRYCVQSHQKTCPS